MLSALQNLTRPGKKKQDQLEGLNRLAAAISSSLDLDNVLQETMQVASDLTGAGVCRIYLPDEQEQKLLLKTSLNSTPEEDELLSSLTLQNSLAGQAFSAGQLVTVAGQRAKAICQTTGAQHQAALACLPLLSKERGRGVMVLGYIKEHRFDDAEQALLTAIGQQVGVVVENAQLYERERRQRQLAETLGKIAQTINSTLELDEVLDRVLVELEKVIAYDSASIALSDGRFYRMVAARGFADREAVLARVSPLESLPVNQECHHLRRPVVIQDTRQDSRFDPTIPGSAQIRSVIVMPLISREEVIGFLHIDSHTPHRYSAQDVEIAFRLAQQAAIAIANARLMEETRHRARQQQALLAIFPEISRELHLETLLQIIIEEAVAVIPGAQRGSILGLEGKSLRFLSVVGYDLEKLQKVSFPVREPFSLRKETLHTFDIAAWGKKNFNSEEYKKLCKYGALEEIEVSISSPILLDREVFGFLNVDNLQDPGALGELDREIVKLFAAQAAVAIANARLHADLEERVRQRTQEIRQQRDRTETILRSVADGVLVTDLEGNIVSANPVANGWLYLGQGDERMENQSLSSFIYQVAKMSEDQVPEVIEFPAWEQKLENVNWQSINCQQSYCPAYGQEENPCWHISDAYCFSPPTSIADREFWQSTECPLITRLKMVSLQAHISAWKEGDRIQGKVIALRDISRQRELNRLQSKFVSTVSHELRTPLANIKIYHSLLKKGQKERRQKYMDVMDGEIIRLERLIQDILDLSRLERRQDTSQREIVDINKMLQEQMEIHIIQAENKGLTLHLETVPETLQVRANHNQLLQVITNLLANALNYTPAGQDIWLSSGMWHLQNEQWRVTGSVPQPDSSVPQPPNEGWAVIIVRDSGEGIPYEDQPHIFDRFYRGVQANLGTPGTGLGLAIVREIVDLHGGDILVESTPGAGSTFTVLLPLPKQDRLVSVLVADDEEEIGYLVSRFLSREGIESRWVPNGQDALESIALKCPDLLILDLDMPVLNGYQVMEHLQSQVNTPSPPILVLSSWTEDKFQRAKRLGATEFLNKPFSGTVLVDVTKRLTGFSKPAKKLETGINNYSETSNI